MTLFNLSSSISSRKEELQRQISQSLTLDNSKEELDLLQFQWVHRYGLESAPHLNKVQDSISLNNTFEGSITSLNSEFDNESESFDEEALNSGDNSRFIKTENLLDTDEVQQNDFKISKEVDLRDSISTNPPSPSLNDLRRWLSNN